MKFRNERPLVDLDTAVRKLLEIAQVVQPDHAAMLHIGMINRVFLDTGASVTEYTALTAAIDRGYLTLHPSGAYVTFTQTGADLFA